MVDEDSHSTDLSVSGEEGHSTHDGRLLGLFLPQLRKFNFWLTEQYFIFQMKQDIKTS